MAAACVGHVATEFVNGYYCLRSHMMKANLLLLFISVLLMVAGSASAASFYDGFETDTSADYIGTRTYGTGAVDFNVSGGMLNVTTGGSTTYSVFHQTASLEVGEAVGIVSKASNGQETYLTVSTITRSPNTGTENGIRFHVQNASNIRARVYRNGAESAVNYGAYPTGIDLTLYVFRKTETVYGVGYHDGADLTVLDEEIEIPQTAGVAGLYVGVEVYGGTRSFDDLHIVVLDDIPSDVATSPLPANNETAVPLDTMLTWNPVNVFAPVKQVLLFREDPNFPADGTVIVDPVVDLDLDDDPKTTQVTVPISLEHGTTYYWRVDAYEPNDVGTQDPIARPGIVWSFTTLLASAEILVGPASQTVPIGGTAQFSITVTEATTGFQWYKDGVALTDGAGITGARSQVLTINDVQLADEGYYYCVASNDLPSQVASTEARLVIQRLVGHWTFDGHMNDIVGGLEAVVVDPNPSGDPNNTSIAYYGAGDDAIIGTGSLALNVGNSSDMTGGWVVIPDSGELYNFYPQGITANAWVKTTAGGYQGLIGKRVDTENAGFNLMATNNSPRAAFALRGSGTATDTVISVNDGQWHMVTGVLRNVDGAVTVELFVDGIRRGTAGPYTNVALTESDLFFGANRLNGMSPLTGYIDDVRIYNYARSLEEIADEYKAVYPGILCIDPDFTGREFDFNGNCVVDLADFAAMAEAWLATGLY